MTAEPEDERETRDTFTAIVRGETDWRVIERYGVTATLDQMPATLSEAKPLPVVLVTVDDLRRGYGTHVDDPVALRRWSQVVEMCGCFDLEPVESDPEGEAILDELWALSFGERPAGGPLSRSARAVAS